MQDQKDIDRSIEATEEELASLNAKRAELIARLQDQWAMATVVSIWEPTS